jgi:hypothetical protein
VTKKELLQVRNLKNEIKSLNEQKAEIRYKMSSIRTPHCVQASSKNEPYQLHNITIQGVAKSETQAFHEHDEQREKIVLDLADREKRCLVEYDKINTFIGTVKDSTMRQMLSLYFLSAKSWQQVANKMGYRDEGTPRKKVEKFLKDSEISES